MYDCLSGFDVGDLCFSIFKSYPTFFFTNVLFFELVVCPLLLWKMLHLTVAVPTTNTVGLDPEQKCYFWLK